MIAMFVAGAALLAASPASASISKHHGKWPSQVSGCGTDYRIGKTARLVTSTGKDFGWVEWRASRKGSCAGYQWVKMHFTRDIGYARDESNYKYWSMVYKNDQWGKSVASKHKYNKTVRGQRYLKAGNYNSRIFYAPNEKACADLITYYSANNNHFLTIKGQGRIPRLTYCA